LKIAVMFHFLPACVKAAAAYLKAVNLSGRQLRKAYDRTIKATSRANDLKGAEDLIDERDDTPVVVGKWECRGSNFGNGQPFTWTLYSDFTVNPHQDGEDAYPKAWSLYAEGIVITNFREGLEIWFGYTVHSPTQQFGFSYDACPGHGRGVVPDSEILAIESATRDARSLQNGNFRHGLEDWKVEDGTTAFRLFDINGERAITTYAAQKEVDRGRMFQCFKVPMNARELEFQLHGGSGPQTYASMWKNQQLFCKMSARDDNTPFRVAWDLSSIRGKSVTLEIIDDSTQPCGFIGAHGFQLSTAPVE